MAAGGNGIPVRDPGIVIIVFLFLVMHDMRVAETAEPFVFRPGVVQGEVQDHLHIPFMAQSEQLLQVLQGAEPGIDPVIIRDVILVIGRGKEDRRQPEAFHAQAVSGERIPVVQVIHPVDDAPEIPGSVPVRIGKGTDEDLIENPAVVLPVQPAPFRGGRTEKQRKGKQEQNKTFHAYSLLSVVLPCYHEPSAFACQEPEKMLYFRKKEKD